jgi:hypothetical protein
VAVDVKDNVILTGAFEGTSDFGGGPLVCQGLSDVFVVELDGSGNHLWSKRFGDAEAQIGYAVAVDEDGGVTLTGGFSGTIGFDAEPLKSKGDQNIFMARISL